MEVSNFVFNILEQLQKANDQIRHRFYQTASVIIPILKVLLHKLTNVVNNGASVSEQLIGRNVLNKLETASNNSQKNVVLKTATFLDPRFKNEFFSECHKNYMIHHFKARFDKVIKEEVLTEETTDFDQFVQVKSSTSPSEPKIVCLEKEIEAYLCKDTNSKTDPTDFWMQNQSQLPILKSLASEYLPIPASASGTEKLFEDGQKMISKGFISGIRDDFIFCSANIAGYGC
ncbi:hypothetical protein GCK72_025711 [Caenorhabditis remanei]|uniref:HAT C-terminal dimerisation domain-containing protein n=1 Tax=Caenorhabditis remanei TaxID=31234 RepID=A0A6A5G3Q1_CAERE|nr:hypothetical protein GCK72_025711 [Caenorhabditis remanei]KAF1749244.1 hypothetical protein GCK72_025711 [Caenorhabditis remanei]